MDGAWFHMAVDLESPVALFARAGFIIPTQTPAVNTKLRFSKSTACFLSISSTSTVEQR